MRSASWATILALRPVLACSRATPRPRNCDPLHGGVAGGPALQTRLQGEKLRQPQPLELLGRGLHFFKSPAQGLDRIGLMRRTCEVLFLHGVVRQIVEVVSRKS